jgi:hypothetical protein
VLDRRRRSQGLAPGASTTLTAPIDILRTDEPASTKIVCQVDQSVPLVQTTRIVAANPLRVAVGPPAGKSVAVRVENPSGEPLSGVLRLTGIDGLRVGQPSAKLQFRSGEREKDLRFTLQDDRVKNFRFGVRVEDGTGRLQLALPAVPMTLIDDFTRYTPETVARAWQVVPDGDPKVASTQSVTVAALPAGPSSPGGSGLKIAYRMDKGWKFIRLVPQTDDLKRIDGRPKAVAVWVYGDGSQNALRLRFVDSSGQTFQPDGPRLARKGWHFATFPLDGTSAGHWGGRNDGAVHYPIRWDSLLLIDSTRRATGPLDVFVGSPVLIYPEQKPAPPQAEQKPAAKKKARAAK